MVEWGWFGWWVSRQGVPGILSPLRWNLDVGTDCRHATRNSPTRVRGRLRGGRSSAVHPTQLEEQKEPRVWTIVTFVYELAERRPTSALFLCRRSLRSQMRWSITVTWAFLLFSSSLFWVSLPLCSRLWRFRAWTTPKLVSDLLSVCGVGWRFVERCRSPAAPGRVSSAPRLQGRTAGSLYRWEPPEVWSQTAAGGVLSSDPPAVESAGKLHNKTTLRSRHGQQIKNYVKHFSVIFRTSLSCISDIWHRIRSSLQNKPQKTELLYSGEKLLCKFSKIQGYIRKIWI